MHRKSKQTSFQTTDFVTKHRSSHFSTSSKAVMKMYDFNFLYQIQETTTLINDPLTTFDYGQTSTDIVNL